jgi:hypothetical protein
MKCYRKNPFKYESNQNPVCPYCDEIYNAWEDKNNYNLLSDGKHTINCMGCNKKYIIETEEFKDYSFSTEMKDI